MVQLTQFHYMMIIIVVIALVLLTIINCSLIHFQKPNELSQV